MQQNHETILSKPIILFSNGFSFYPADFDFASCKTIDDYIECFNFSDYLVKDSRKDILKKLYLIINLLPRNMELELELDSVPNKFYQPILARMGKGITVEANQRFVVLSENQVCLFPGYIEDNCYKSFSLEQIFDHLDNKSNYTADGSFFQFNIVTDLVSLKQELIKFHRRRIKYALKFNLNQIADFYSIIDDQLPFERVIIKDHFLEFPLFFSELNQVVSMYISDKSKLVPGTQINFPFGYNTTKEILIEPVLASSESSAMYNKEIKVPLRCLQLNYAYRISEGVYEDFVGIPEWVVCPMCLDLEVKIPLFAFPELELKPSRLPVRGQLPK